MDPRQRRFWSLLGACVGAAACLGPVAGSTCDHGGCPAGRVCNLATQLCLADQPPTIALDSPTPADLLDSGMAHVSGVVVDDVRVTAAEVRVGGAAGSWLPIGLDGEARFAIDVPLPPQDLAPVLIEVRAWDDQRHASVVSVTPLLDDLPPAGAFSAAWGQRDAPPQFSVTFTEPVTTTDGGAPVVLSGPATPVGWDDAHRTFTYASLVPDTSYTATVPPGAVVDRLGHPNVDGGGTWFRTAPTPPTSGLTIPFANDQVDGFDVASDLDGVVTLVAHAAPVSSGSPYFAWFRFDSATGALQTVDVSTGALTEIFQAIAGQSTTPELQTARATGFFHVPVGQPFAGVAYYEVADGGEQVVQGNIAGLLPAPLPCEVGDPVARVVPYGSSNALEVAWGTVEYPIGLAPTQLWVRSAEDWQLLELGGGVVARQRFTATCTSPGGGNSPDMRPVEPDFLTGVAAQPDLSVALAAAGQSLYVYDDTGSPQSRVEVCFPCDSCAAFPTAGQVPADLHVASAHQGSRVIGARRNDQGQVELLERDLALCQAGWTVLSAVPDSSPAQVLSFKPVMFGTHPGVVLREGSALRIFWL